MAKFRELIDPLVAGGRVRILDMGGTPEYWRALPGLYGDPRFEITVVNLEMTEGEEQNLVLRRGNACALDYPDNAFDLVHSNSVIEHVGRWPDMCRMAAEVRRLAPSYFIQTPDIWFPIEPHYKLPLIHWLPEPARAWVVARAGKAPRDVGISMLSVQQNTLLSAGQMRYLFPDAELWRERWMGLSKSVVAIRRSFVRERIQSS